MKEQQIILSHSSIREYENDGDDQDRYYLPWRVSAEAAARVNMGQKVLTILPRYQQFEESLTLLETELLGGRRLGRIYTSDTSYLMDEDIARELGEDLKSRVNSGTVIHPYQATDEFQVWARPLQERGAQVFGDEKDRTDRFWWGQKGAYHRWIDDLSTPSLSEKLKIPVPRGFIAKNSEEAHEASEMLGTKAVVLKPIYGAGGFRIGFCETVEDIDKYEWPVDQITGQPMPVAVQEKVEIAHDELGEKTFSLQFNGESVFGSLTRQIVHDSEWSGNISPSGVSSDFEKLCTKYAAILLGKISPKGSGGIDFADFNGRPIILEVNGGRPTGAHTPKHFKQSFVPDAPFFMFEKVVPGKLTAHESWDLLKSYCPPGDSQPLGLDRERQSGVFPIVWLKDSWGMLAAFGESFQKVHKQLSQAKEVLLDDQK